MRIALLTRRFDPHGGGTERDLIITAECLCAAGHEITIFAREMRGPSRDFKVRQVGGIALGRTMGLLTFAYGAPAAARREGAGEARRAGDQLAEVPVAPVALGVDRDQAQPRGRRALHQILDRVQARQSARLPAIGVYLSSAELFPSSWRATISSWICWVPSKMSRIFASRAHFSSRSFSP